MHLYIAQIITKAQVYLLCFHNSAEPYKHLNDKEITGFDSVPFYRVSITLSPRKWWFGKVSTLHVKSPRLSSSCLLAVLLRQPNVTKNISSTLAGICLNKQPVLSWLCLTWEHLLTRCDVTSHLRWLTVLFYDGENWALIPVTCQNLTFQGHWHPMSECNQLGLLYLVFPQYWSASFDLHKY